MEREHGFMRENNKITWLRLWDQWWLLEGSNTWSDDQKVNRNKPQRIRMERNKQFGYNKHPIQWMAFDEGLLGHSKPKILEDPVVTVEVVSNWVSYPLWKWSQ